MNWRCKLCGFSIKDREDRRRIRIMDNSVYVYAYCDNCFNWSILDRIPIEKMREYIVDKFK